MQERRGDLATVGCLGERLDRSTAETSDLAEGTGQRGGGNSSAAVVLINEEAGDAPVRQGYRGRAVGTLTLDPRQFVRRAELAPADAVNAVVYERRVRPSVSDSVLFRGATLRTALRASAWNSMHQQPPQCARRPAATATPSDGPAEPNASCRLSPGRTGGAYQVGEKQRRSTQQGVPAIIGVAIRAQSEPRFSRNQRS